ncbi:FAD-dependent oxidoreductase [Nocardioides acrostichi]|uniref:Cholesterol oxidase n=1 Tax=Nocardioides acrostichi TaxID=2784339 RepID=A0A930Y6U6_9ACTN|nr:GMC family oxidoreductase [Nocardioides acrostichi]MBF4161362.1 GMC family oxidoreductase [Nocardioides acrostichi]
MQTASDSAHYDVVVIGSGFGGSVTALRLSEKGYRVGVLETGRRWSDADFAAQGRRDLLWAPALRMFGPLRLSSLGPVSLFTAVGVGGGSLVYANTLYEPHDAFFDDSAWASITDWRTELAPFYDQARRMLGAARNPCTWEADDVLHSVADDLGAGATWTPVDAGVLFGSDAQGEGADVGDPFFGGAGPGRTTCTHCARCTTGCPIGAKNTLPKNYLYLAEAAGARVHELTEVVGIEPRAGGYRLTTRRPGARRSPGPVFTADQVVVSAAARGTQELLLRQRENGNLPRLSSRLGQWARSNSEAIVLVDAGADRGYDRGIAITSSMRPETHTHVELCRASPQQESGSLVNVPLVDGGPRRLRRFAVEHLREMPRWVQRPRGASKRSIQLLVMQSLDNSLTAYSRRGRLRARQGTGQPNPSWLPVAHDVARRFAAKVGGRPMSMVTDLLGKPATAHYIGGAVLGATAEDGVVDPYHRVFGHPGLHVIDGSTIGANLGVNPSLTITAMAERAVALWPNQGEVDPRPALGEAYEPVTPVPPLRPVVPEAAPGALRLPITPV